MRPLVEFCVNNLTEDVLAIKKELEKDFELDVLEYGCLGSCGICAEQPFAMVDGEVIRAATGAELLERIYKLIDEKETYI
ncbi:DUF1450 domain-containing protein [Hazenella sp. IB182357]|uniref:DUF1450 domain-containing protein n=1 Tax=Polycladospora coralii TaxID=2771432 RepID=A0A926N7A4_9BACL|nr:DUF1450 domain-containing protein [Polycladospora coralii]MBD1370897.1 DUF1450 domain-containing protein [Polycladospora coralii]MBS7529836.1 DUF1450 domain-containing protein [Polycladospora coralii]